MRWLECDAVALRAQILSIVKVGFSISADSGWRETCGRETFSPLQMCRDYSVG